MVRSTRAFTLLELLVAFAVTSILLGLILAVVSNLLPNYRRATGTLLTQSQADLILEQVATDLQALVVANSPEVRLRSRLGDPPAGGMKPDRRGYLDESGSFQPRFPSSPLSGNPDDPANPPTFPPLSDYFFGAGGADVTLFTSSPAFQPANPDGEPNETIRAVRYRLVRRPVTSAAGAPHQYMLIRGDLWAEETLQSGYDLESEPYSPANTTGDFVQINGQGDDIIFAGNVIDFGVRFFRLSETGAREKILFPVDGEELVNFRGQASDPNQHYPELAEIMVRILTPEGEKIIDSIERAGGSDSTKWWDLALEHSRVFTRTVQIPARSSGVAPFFTDSGSP